ncbi:magnesium/cobalt transporter CorA [Thermococcus sp.]|uniref:magnesium/cobalt transporter CorA n=1 Tax=Thermococcus sp. TaxID=35749 RepID=UPI000F1EE0AA|nr:magnesium/cobalt transporter CorA [Thermococcus sp.]MCD6144662.1 magnesium/cobalt transporter CorA [Thermococcus sp.]RLF86017.1 MAG: magnesium and cobalt transport protein CorA [Thermococci archaeon]
MDEAPKITIFAYSDDKFEEKRIKKLEEALDYKDYRVVWINIDGIGYLEELKNTFRVHDVTVKAIKRIKSRARLTILKDHLFILLHQVYELKGGLKKERTAIFLKDNFVITMQERSGDVFNSIRESIRHNEGLFRERDADYLLYALLDAIIGNYVPILENISSQMEILENKVLKDKDKETLRRIHGIRRRILFARRTIFPLLEVFRRLRLEGREFFKEETQGYLEELYNHVMEILDIIESQRDMANGLVEIYYSTISMRINEIIRILTVVSTIFIPLTFITGIYGMNFNPRVSPYNMPELNWYYGYPLTLLAMLAIALGMLYYFKRKEWL